VREIQLIQSLALKLSQERDPERIVELIDEIRNIASAYLESTEAKAQSRAAEGGA
jgi:hypothetical protein